ncbi:MAG TPA: SRPBCC family protein [Acidimicrobiales bacterium]|nr:SRPBCC family protein [Acidimicrobiales bacterium]
MAEAELVQAGDRWELRFTRRLAHDQDKVWRAVTEAQHLEAWFPQQVVGDWVVGAPLRFVMGGDESTAFDGEVLAVEPPKLLEFRWGTDSIRIELEPSDGGCVLTLIDTFDEVGKAARDAAGWHVCLEALVAHVDGNPAPGPSRERWRAVHPDYVAAFPAEASTIGPPPGRG